MLTILGLTFLVTVVIGVPIAFGLGLAAVAGILAWGKVSLWLVPQRMFTGVDSFVFMAIPFFILAGELMTTSGILDRLLKFADALVGHIRGGLAHVNIVGSMVFAGISGSAVADAAALGAVLIPISPMSRSHSAERCPPPLRIPATSPPPGFLLVERMSHLDNGETARSHATVRFSARCNLRIKPPKPQRPLLRHAFVNQRFAVSGEGGDLGFDAGDDALYLAELGVEMGADGYLFTEGRKRDEHPRVAG